MTYTGFTAEHHYNNSHVYQMDCMELMRQTPDKYYDLGVVDPPYGIGEDGGKNHTRGGHLAGKKILNQKALYLQKITKRFQEMIKRPKAKNTLKNFSE